MNGRRKFLRDVLAFLISGSAIGGMFKALPSMAFAKEAPRRGKWYGFGVSVDKCIGCTRCVDACKTENDVPREPFYFRTWVERYVIRKNGEVTVRTVETKPEGIPE
ncbi:MAG TPA: 4Fe-4S binding protein, partial [Candidatus Deferrimicrobiaceae bacterium]